jgi:uncharacterized membrane protein YedE/YeeE
MNPSFINASVGGVLIALSVIIMMGVLGRVTGISGILWQTFSISPVQGDLTDDNKVWRPVFLIGLVLGAAIIHYALDWDYPSASNESTWFIVLSGLLVGFGTKLGSGCTSGHGICGIGRFSMRSIVATLSFMAAGIITVAIKNLAAA